jgi:hypothetical protein
MCAKSQAIEMLRNASVSYTNEHYKPWCEEGPNHNMYLKEVFLDESLVTFEA